MSLFLFASQALRTLTQKCPVDVGKFGVVSSVFAMPTPFRTRRDCVDRLGRFVIPSRR